LQAVFLDRFEIGQVRAGYWLETQQQWMQIALWFFLNPDSEFLLLLNSGVSHK